MAKLSEWFGEFVAEHQTRFPRPDWPATDDRAFWATWHSHFLKAGLMNREVASEASDRLALDPPAFIDNHLPKLLELSQQIYRERHQRGEVLDISSREAAEHASRGCECLASGIVSIQDDQGRSFGAYCPAGCAMQVWVEQQHREKTPAIHRRFLSAKRIQQYAETVGTF